MRVFFFFHLLHFVCCDDNWANFHKELFGTGDFRNEDYRGGAVTKHLSSSTEDLCTLFKAEKEVVKALKTNYSDFSHSHKDAYLKSVDFGDYEESSYVLHPINAFHMLQRTTKWLPKLLKVLPDLDFKFSLPSASDANIGAANGIADLQEYHGLDQTQLIKGIIEDHSTGNIFKSNSKLSINEVLKIATAARDANYLQSYVNWCKAALEAAKVEKVDKKLISSIKKLIQQGKVMHDEGFMQLDLKKPVLGPPSLAKRPFSPSSLTKNQEEKLQAMQEIFSSRFENLLTIDDTQFMSNDLPHRMDVFLKPRIQKLCQGTYERPAYLEKGLKCILLHHFDPYLRLGPFKLEILHRDPEIAIIKDFASSAELDRIKNGARGHMKSTPYVTGTTENSYSKLRTSKVMYMNELLVPMAMDISKKVTLATKYKMKEEKYASENFQVMNYGIGGRISGHLDSTGGSRVLSSENDDYGGLRVTTFMIYLSDVQAGGHTIFPQAGIFVKPKEGDALFWFNVSSHGTFDSRIYHLGCPVLYGNKWIANKWVKILPQFQNYPCLKDKKYFSVQDL